MSNEQQTDIYLRLHFAKVRAHQLEDIRQYFGSLASAVEAGQAAWERSGILTERQLERLFAETLDAQLNEALSWSAQPHHSILTLADSDYPSLLAEISDPPILLYVLGEVAMLSEPQLGIVGSRSASKYGKAIAQDFASHLASVGLTITSGLASGIDQAAHEGALKGGAKAGLSEQGSTIAVVATGLDRVYPASNRALAHQISEAGAIVSEYPLGTKPLAHQFPERNRIISGLSSGVLVVEAALKSGSLITARLAMEQGREVFAVPGSINSPHSKGCHQLIRQGAKLVESGQDVLEELSSILELSFDERPSAVYESASVSDEEASQGQGLLKWIEFEPIGLDELAVLSKWPVSEIQSQLLMLEVSGRIEAMSAGRWRRLR
ncbi:MAG: DNA-processing protein DprA [Hydrogenovibrio sp.]|nr:DNA-processing protein DprA [Hydrogenovibrio sp.]